MYEASDGSGGLSSEQEELQGHLFEPLAFFLGMGKGWECVCVCGVDTSRNIWNRSLNSSLSVSPCRF